MEEVYIIKLKGLPSSQESLRDNKASFYYRKDLTGEALLGFGILHTFIGLTLVILSIINLIQLDINKDFVLGTGIWCGVVFALTGLMAIITAHKRKSDISKSKIQVKIFLILSVISLLLTTSYVILLAFDLKEKSFNHYIASNIFMSFIFELFTSLLSLFTCVRIIWPGSLSFCAKDWPMHQKLKRKIIVSTQIYTNGVKQNEDVIRNLGPNCIISLSPPPNEAIISSDNYSDKCITICEFCAKNNSEYKSHLCQHNIRAHCLNNEDIDEQYDSEFDVENFDSILDDEVNAESTPREHREQREQEIELNYEINTNESLEYSHESENKYETIDGNKTFDDNNQKSEENDDKHSKQSLDLSESNVLPKSSEKSDECLNEV